MANSSLTLSSIDFDTLKGNFKEYLKTQSVLRDYDFDGSNISVLLDVMAYNSYLNSFYLNMVASEMFLDSAQKYDSVVSHAKELNYVPRSTKSSVAEINLVFDTVGVSSLTIPKGTRFSGINSNGSFIFTTNETKVLTSSNSTFSLANLQIFEGDYIQESYVVDYNIENQQFLITNQNIDTSSITVNVLENNGASNVEFRKVENLFGLSDTSEIYFLQGTQNGLYEVTFGDGLFGRKPINASTILINYRVASGISSDGVSTFTIADDLNLSNDGDITVNSLTTTLNSSGGAEQENLESIRFTAPRYFATQQRAITNDDYSSLIFSQFGGEISDVVVYGGQDIQPKQYGRVVVSLKPSSGTVAPNYVKNKILTYLVDYTPLPNRIILTDPDYLYCSINSEIQYDVNVTSKTAAEIETIVRNAIDNYSSLNLEKFDNDLRYSRLVNAIDNSDTSITSNDTTVRLVKRLTPVVNTPTTYEIYLDNEIQYSSTSYIANTSHSDLHSSIFDLHSEHSSVVSSTFTYNATDGSVYPLSFIEEDQQGNVKIFSTIGTQTIPIETIGTVDYVNGVIKLNNINIASYDDHISLYVKTHLKDILATKNKIILIDQTDINISVVETRK